MNYLNYNGKLHPENSLIASADNRALRYGDGLFETIMYKNGEFILLDEHLGRLWEGIQLLQFECPKLFTKNYIITELQNLMDKNKLTTARVRLTIIRGNGGLYDAINHQPNFIIQGWPITKVHDQLNINGLQICIYREARKICDALSNIKHNNYLPYLMGALFAKKNKCNDAVILNQHLRICESTIANIFIIKDQVIYTPSLAEGCVNGIIRQNLLTQLPALGFKIKEIEINEEMLMNAEEIFLSNSIYNIRWVASANDKIYSNHYTQKIFRALCKTNAAGFC